MIYLRAVTGETIVILEPGNINKLKEGLPLRTPDGKFLIAYTPDVDWLTSKLVENVKDLTPDKLDEILKESLKRSEVYHRPKHPPFYVNVSENKNKDKKGD